MCKTFKSYLCIWLILFFTFNILSFVAIPTFTTSFWIGYVCVILSFIGQLLCTKKAFNSKNLEQMFYNLSIISISYTGLIISFIVAAICMIVTVIPYFVAVIVCMLVLAFTMIAVLKADIAIDNAIAVGTKVKTNTYFMKSLIAEAETLYTKTRSIECKKLYEALRYSDPVSCEDVSILEEQISNLFNQYKTLIEKGNLEDNKEILDNLINFIDERNKKVRQFK